MNDLQTKIKPIRAIGVADAIRIEQIARGLCMKASYHPAGGEKTYTTSEAVTHTVWVEGTDIQFENFERKLADDRSKPKAKA